MTRLSYLILCFFSLSLCACEKKPAIETSEVDAIFARWNHQTSNHESIATPGCALGVIHQGEIIYSKGYGMADVENHVPITPSSIFYIGSVSKQFVVSALVLLEEAGKLSLDDDVRKYLPELPDYGQPIRIHHLIHHTSGLRDNLTLWELSGKNLMDDIPEEEIFELICRQEGLNFAPGESYAYSNSCYLLMSMIIEKVSGQSLRDFAQENIFEPLGMHHSQFNDDNRRIIPNRAFGYTQINEDSIGNMMMRFDLVGSGGLYSSVEDLYLWDQNFYHNILGKRGQGLIEQLQTNGKYNNGEDVDYAYAMINGEYRGLKTIHHTGSMGGYRAMYLRFPEEAFSVIILGNVDDLNPRARAYEVASVFLKDKLNTETETTEPSDTDEGNSLATNDEDYAIDPDQLSGKYYSPELDTHYSLIYSEEEKLMYMRNPRGKEIPLHITAKNTLSDNTYKIMFNENYQTFNMNYAGTKGIIFEKQSNLSKK